MSDQNARFYNADTLDVVSEVPRAKPKKLDDGTTSTMRNATLGDAKKMGLLVSNTTILKDTYATSPQIIDWQKDQVLNACIEFPFDRQKIDTEIESYKSMILAKSNEVRNATADRGKFIHACINRFIVTGTMTDDPICNHAIEQLKTYMVKRNVTKATSEKHLGSRKIGFAGTPDLYCNTDSNDIIIDMKSTNFKSFDKPYPSWKLQLGGYHILTQAKPGTRLVQMVIDRETGDALFLPHDNAEKWAEAFMHLYEVWCIEKEYDVRKI